jgi:hypothetical protein
VPTRGIDLPTVLTVSSDVEQLSVKLALDETEFTHYRVSLKSRGGSKVLWRSTTLTPEQGKHGAALTLNLPAERVKNGIYSFDVIGLDQGREVPAASYIVNVKRAD